MTVPWCRFPADSWMGTRELWIPGNGSLLCFFPIGENTWELGTGTKNEMELQAIIKSPMANEVGHKS